MKISRRAAGLRTRAAMEKDAIRHTRLTLLDAAHHAHVDADPIARADARTTMADCHAALADMRSA